MNRSHTLEAHRPEEGRQTNGRGPQVSWVSQLGLKPIFSYLGSSWGSTPILLCPDFLRSKTKSPAHPIISLLSVSPGFPRRNSGFAVLQHFYILMTPTENPLQRMLRENWGREAPRELRGRPS